MSNVTTMTDEEARRDGTVQEFVGKAVCPDIPGTPARQAEYPIANAIQRGQPGPTRIGATGPINLVPETFFGGAYGINGAHLDLQCRVPCPRLYQQRGGFIMPNYTIWELDSWKRRAS